VADALSIESIQFEQSLDGQSLDIRRVRSQLNDKAFDDTPVSALDEGTFRFHWRMKQLSQYALEEAKDHKATVAMNWKFVGCRTQTGVARTEVTGLSKAAVAPQNLRVETAESQAPDLVSGPKVRFGLRSKTGDEITNIGSPRFTVTYFSEGLTPALGLGLAGDGQVAVQSGGQPTTSISATGTLDVYTSKMPATAGAAWEHAGTAASTAALGGGGKALVTLTVQSRGATQAAPVEDVLTALVDF
jgi:hypothetical protein